MTYASRNGFTLIETMLALAILGVAVVGSMTAINFVSDQATHQTAAATEDKSIGMLVESVRANIAIYQTTFAPSGSLDSNGVLISDGILLASKMPYAWNADKMIPVSSLKPAELAAYPGRMGFIIQPVDANPGTFLVYMRVFEDIKDNPPKEPNSYPFKDYKFIAVGAK